MKYRVLVPLASYVMPEWLLRFLDRNWHVDFDPADGWSLWMDISYYRWCRKDRRRRVSSR